MAKSPKGNQSAVSKNEAKELRGKLREVFTRCSVDDVLKRLPGHIRLKDRQGNDVDTKDSDAVLSGIHDKMLKRDFDAIAKLVDKFTPKEQSDNAKKKAKYAAKAAARHHDGGMA